MPKGILKKDGKKGIKSIAWDEIAIAEHDLTRGGRMKIDEPKTPFVHYSIESDVMDSEELPPMQLSDAVQKMQIEKLDQTSDWSSGGEDCDGKFSLEEEINRKKKEFDRKRKSHYNMKHALKVDLEK